MHAIYLSFVGHISSFKQIINLQFEIVHLHSFATKLIEPDRLLSGDLNLCIYIGTAIAFQPHFYRYKSLLIFSLFFLCSKLRITAK